MRRLALVSIVCSVACYHATIETGLTPSTEVISKPFAASWIDGLVPPSTVSTAAKCQNGVAIVETQLSFVNQVVWILTAWIYTPMSIKVTCATAGSAPAPAEVPSGSHVIGAICNDGVLSNSMDEKGCASHGGVKSWMVQKAG